MRVSGVVNGRGVVVVAESLGMALRRGRRDVLEGAFVGRPHAGDIICRPRRHWRRRFVSRLEGVGLFI